MIKPGRLSLYQKLIAELDDEIARLMHTLPNATEHLSPIPKRTKRTACQRMGDDPSFDLRSELNRIAGVDLTDIPGMSAIAAQVVLTEVGPDVSRFRNGSAFASWLGLCPAKRISGGKVLSTKTRKVNNRVAIVLRLGAKSLSRAKDYFGAFFRRMRARLGNAQAITATAHKLARTVYHHLNSKEPYTEIILLPASIPSMLMTLPTARFPSGLLKDSCRAALKSRIASLYFSMLFRDLTTLSLHSNHGLVYLNSGQSYA